MRLETSTSNSNVHTLRLSGYFLPHFAADAQYYPAF
jgi:hypothetical protein